MRQELSLILYGSPHKLSNAHRKVSGARQPAYYVRVEVVYRDLDTALSMARPRQLETVLNTVAAYSLKVGVNSKNFSLSAKELGQNHKEKA